MHFMHFKTNKQYLVTISSCRHSSYSQHAYTIMHAQLIMMTCIHTTCIGCMASIHTACQVAPQSKTQTPKQHATKMNSPPKCTSTYTSCI